MAQHRRFRSIQVPHLTAAVPTETIQSWFHGRETE
jgi:hypothetical protein